VLYQPGRKRFSGALLMTAPPSERDRVSKRILPRGGVQ
jgi:hypothetical protein